MPNPPPTEPFGLVLAREHLATTFDHHIIVGIDESGENPQIRVFPNTQNVILFNAMISATIKTLEESKQGGENN